MVLLELVRPEHAGGESEGGASTKRLEEVADQEAMHVQELVVEVVVLEVGNGGEDDALAATCASWIGPWWGDPTHVRV